MYFNEIKNRKKNIKRAWSLGQRDRAHLPNLKKNIGSLRYARQDL
jgi:hypothetical protein